MKKNRLILFFTVILLFITSISCDAPRENPVDPNNTENRLSSISGVVKSHGYPFTPISNADVFWKNNNILIQTDEDGKYSIPNVIKKNGWLTFECVGYSADSVFINWKENGAVANEIFLNSKPQLDSLEFFSVVENRFQFNQKYSIRIRARVTDYEGVNDIVNVLIENEELALLKVLTYDHTQDFYEGTLTLNELKITSLNEIIGKNFKVLVKDLEDKVFTVGITNIKRIINEEVELILPINNGTVTKPFKLSWKRFTPGYSFKYKVEIFTNETSPSLVYSKYDIAKDSISLLVNSEFEGSNYFWVIWAIDEFENQSRSKPGSFIIGN
ncbi:MAG: carboxypeptidase-like regulatory domain-containing protein [Bacteroidetes bacterium]|nr:carboxypeptidase-like regulatory domain-containing protein [Bacteroidota bacterium]MBU1116475.1 carboxypeptidase-like regulatory domain-containing protein [Bacteroidota bacterium]MBU1797290.1 carboxypeptidase-like regulatory domain-containing protein [Bacteroidota bacterium]